MEYRVLGNLEVTRDGAPIDLGAHRQRALLALLLTSPNKVFSTDQLIEGLWGDDGDADKQNALWVYVSGLRKALEPDREKRTDGTILLTRSPGYVIAAEPDDLDAAQFERLVTEGRSLVETDPAAASLVLGEALALWRGRAFEEFTYESFAQNEIARLEELRLEAVEARIDADLKRGLSRELVSELESLVREHPLREWSSGQYMLALYRSNRQADALRAYQQLRVRLAEELGIEPSQRLRSLEEQMVTGDEALLAVAPPPSSGTAPGLAVRGYELREQIGEGAFGVAYRAYQPAVGREVAIKVIRPELANDPTFIRRFEAEAQLVARLEHPHIVPLYDYWREPDAAFLVMRLMKGGSLDDVLEDSALPPERATMMAEQLGGALQTAHRSHVVHRDIKPANILIDDEGNAYLSDFGIALGPDDDVPGGTSETTTLGPPYASPEQLAGGPVTATSDVYSLAVVVAQTLTGLRGEIVQIRGALPTAVVPVIDRATDPDTAARYKNVDEFVNELREAIGGTDPSAPVISSDVYNPYKGLRSFDEADCADFHGRERLIDRLLSRLGEPGSRGRFVAVVGPSGSGKSSVVKAGLLPALRLGAIPQSKSWFTIEMTPAPHPFEELEAALSGIAVDPPTSLLEQLAGSDNGLTRAVRRVLPDEGSQLVLVIDQFEELFTQVDETTAARFLDTLVAGVTDPHSRVRVVITLRADFYDRPLRHRGLGELLRDGTEIITPMTPEELERAIAGPVEPLGVTFEPALIAELVRDVADRSGALPLLQYTLTELFEARQGSQIVAAAYRETGGVSGALVSRAEGLLAELGDAAIDVARQIFLRLVTLGEGTDDTRRRVLLSELDQLTVDRGELKAVLDTFGRHRLISFDRDPVTRGPTVEISHEALLTEWDRLRGWIDRARHDVRNQRRLAVAMSEWVAADNADDYLLRGGLLDQLNGWATTTTLPLSAPEGAFLATSVAERDRAAIDDREREQRTADAERREQQKSRQLTAVGMAGVVVAALAVFGIWQWISASEAKGETESLLLAGDLVTASEIALDSDPELALLLAVEAVRETADLGFATEEAVDAVHWSAQELGLQYAVGPDTPVAVRSGPKGLAGVYALPPSELLAFAEDAISRRLTDEECEEFLAASCPAHADLTADLPLRGGMDAYGATEPGITALAGTRLTFAASSLRGDEAFTAQLDAFTELTGIRIDHVASENQDMLTLATGDLDRPDLVGANGPIPVWARERAMDVTAYLDEETLRSDYGEYLLSFGTVDTDGRSLSPDGTVAAVPFDMDLKGLVYYPKAAFAAAGYDVPDTWDELIELSHQIVADGGTPWCFGFSSGFASGWPGTDFIESLVLRIGGVDDYDAWAAHQVPFTAPTIVEAGRRAEALIFEPGFVRAGPEAISNESWDGQLFHMLEKDRQTGEPTPDCWLHHQTDFGFGNIPPGTSIGVDLDFFMLPPVTPSEPVPAMGGFSMAAPLEDRPEVRAFIEYIASPEWGEIWASGFGSITNGLASSFIPPNQRFDAASFGDGATDPQAAVLIALSDEIRSALEAGLWRLDASDMMPLPIGAWKPDFTPGAFWQGMLDWTDGARTIDEVLVDVEEAWVALERDGAA